MNVNGVIDMLAIWKTMSAILAWLSSPAGLVFIGVLLSALVRMGIIPQSVADMIREVLESIGQVVVRLSASAMNFALPVDDSVFSKADVAAMNATARRLRKAGKCSAEISAAVKPVLDLALSETETTPPKV